MAKAKVLKAVLPGTASNQPNLKAAGGSKTTTRSTGSKDAPSKFGGKSGGSK